MPLLTNQRSRFLGGARKWWLAGGAPLPVVAYCPKGAADLAASYVNLANPGTNNAVPGTAPTFAAATGWGFTGSQDLSTGVLSASNMSIICRFSAATGDWRALFGSDTSSNGIYAQVRYTSGTVHTYNNGTTRISTGSALTSGVIAIAGTRGYLDGVEETSALNNSIGTPAVIYIGCRLSSGSASSSYAGNIQAIAIYSSVLTAPQVAAVTAAMQAL